MFSACYELTPHVQLFLFNNTIAQRTTYDSQKSVMFQRLFDLIQRRNSRLIYGDYSRLTW